MLTQYLTNYLLIEEASIAADERGQHFEPLPWHYLCLLHQVIERPGDGGASACVGGGGEGDGDCGSCGGGGDCVEMGDMVLRASSRAERVERAWLSHTVTNSQRQLGVPCCSEGMDYREGMP